MRQIWQWLGTMGLVAVLAGCGGGESGNEPQSAPSGTALLGPAGGSVRAEDGAQVSFPPEALAAEVTVSIVKDGTGAPPLPPAGSAAGAVYTITPHGGGLRAHAEVTLPVDLKDLQADEQLVLVTAQPGDLQWTVLSGASYAGGTMRAPVMHFSFFQVVVLRGISMPSLTLTMSTDGLQRSNNVGGPGVARFSPNFQFEPWSTVQTIPPVVEARLSFPAPPLPTAQGVFGANPPQSCLPVSYDHGASNWRFVRNGVETVTPVVRHSPLKLLAEAAYPRFDNEIRRYTVSPNISSMFEDSRSEVLGAGAMHVYGQDQPRRGVYAPANGQSVWATPPAGNVVDNDLLTWSGRVEFLAVPHNGHIRIDSAVATTCNMRVEAVPLSLRLNLNSGNSQLDLYEGIKPDLGAGVGTVGVAVGGTAVIPFSGVESLSVRFEYSRDLVNWQATPVAAQYIRDDGRVGIGHRYAIVIPNVQPEQAGLYRAWACSVPAPATSLQPAGPSLCVSRAAAELRVASGPPTVTRNPAATTVRVGESANFDASFDFVVPTTVQWQRRPLIEAAFNVGTWTNIAGGEATFNLYATPPTSPSDSGMLYRAVFTNALGSTATAPALLTVLEQLAAPLVVAQPAGVSVAPGGTAVFVATVTSAGSTSYQWQRDGVDLVGRNTAVLTLNNTTAADAGSYSLRVSNPVGSVTTQPATLTLASSLASEPPTITAAPASISVPAGGSASFAVGVSGTGPYIYRWQKNGVTIDGAEAASFVIASATAADAASYTVRVSNALGAAESQAATLTVTAATVATAPVITTPPIGLATLPGSSVTFAAAATGSGPLGYQWRRDGVDIPGATTPVLHIAAVAAVDAGSYSLQVRNSVGVALSPGVPLILVGAPAISAQPLAASVTAGSTARFSVTASGDALRYLWTRNGLPIPGATSAVLVTAPVALTDAGAVYGVIVYNGAGAVVSQGAALTVTAAVVAGWQGPPVPLQTDSEGFNKALAWNSAGQAIALWSQPGGVGASRYTPSAGWQPPLSVSGSSTTFFYKDTAVAMSGSGRAVAVWHTVDSVNTRVQTSIFTPAGGWSVATTLSIVDDSGGFAPRIAIDGQGNAVAAWVQRASISSRRQVFASRYDAASATWGTALRLDTDSIGVPAESPELAMNAAGVAFVIWPASSAVPGVFSLWARRLSADAALDALSLVDAAVFNPPEQRIAVDAGGHAMAVFKKQENTGFASIGSSRFDALGGAWGASAVISLNNVNRSTAPQIAFDASGQAVAAWVQYDGTQDLIVSRRHTLGGGWATPQQVATGSINRLISPSLAVNAGGTAVLAWRQDALYVSASVQTPGSAWRSPELAPTTGSDGAAYSVSSAVNAGIDDDGNATIVWFASQGINNSRFRVYGGRYR
jgi:hypothetical protein